MGMVNALKELFGIQDDEAVIAAAGWMEIDEIDVEAAIKAGDLNVGALQDELKKPDNMPAIEEMLAKAGFDPEDGNCYVGVEAYTNLENGSVRIFVCEGPAEDAGESDTRSN